MLQNIFFFSFVHVPECAHCTPSFSALYLLQNVFIKIVSTKDLNPDKFLCH